MSLWAFPGLFPARHDAFCPPSTCGRRSQPVHAPLDGCHSPSGPCPPGSQQPGMERPLHTCLWDSGQARDPGQPWPRTPVSSSRELCPPGSVPGTPGAGGSRAPEPLRGTAQGARRAWRTVRAGVPLSRGGVGRPRSLRLCLLNGPRRVTWGPSGAPAPFPPPRGLTGHPPISPCSSFICLFIDRVSRRCADRPFIMHLCQTGP